jgi:hypothetical protein
MRILRNQSGKSIVGWLIILAVIVIVAVPGVKVISVYLKDAKINDTLKKLETDVLKAQAESTITPEKIKIDLLNRLLSENIPEVTEEDVTVTETSDKYIVRVQHLFVEKIIGDKYYTRNFDKTIEIPLVIKNL